MHGLDDLSKAVEKSRAINAPGLLLWFMYFVRSSNSLKWEAMFLPLTKPIWSSLMIDFITFYNLRASALVNKL